MIKSWNDFKNIINEYSLELKQNNTNNKVKFPERSVCLQLNKPLDVFTGQYWEVSFDETNEKYILNFGQGETFPEDKIGLAWYVDSHTIIFFERPFQNKPLKLLKQLLPSHNIDWDKNDIYIDGKKIGPSLPTGYGKREGTKVIKNTGSRLDISYIEKSDNNTGHIYCLRWDDLDGLNKRFEGIQHHQDRLDNKAGLTTIGEYLNITKEEFENMLEKQ